MRRVLCDNHLGHVGGERRGDMCYVCGRVYDDVVREARTLLFNGERHTIPSVVTGHGGWRRPNAIERLRRAIEREL